MRCLRAKTHMIKDTHGGHVVGAGVDAALVDHDDALLLSERLQGPHRVRDVGRREEVLAYDGDAQQRDRQTETRRERERT